VRRDRLIPTDIDHKVWGGLSVIGIVHSTAREEYNSKGSSRKSR
jgi:hypothetical protein